MDVSHCINMLGPGLDAPVQAIGRPTEVRSGEVRRTRSVLQVFI